MTEAQKVFETLMKANGYSDEELTRKNQGYVSNTVQTRWKYFLLGWEMRGMK
jgi:hypothetical protein